MIPSGSVRVPGPITPTSVVDEYPTHYAHFGRGGYRSVNALDDVKDHHKESGMVVYVIPENALYRLEDGVWVFMDPPLPLTGGTVSGPITSPGPTEPGHLATREYVDSTATAKYTHEQLDPVSTWVITHNLGFRPGVTTETSLKAPLRGAVVHQDQNTVSIRFSGAISGTAYLRA